MIPIRRTVDWSNDRWQCQVGKNSKISFIQKLLNTPEPLCQERIIPETALPQKWKRWIEISWKPGILVLEQAEKQRYDIEANEVDKTIYGGKMSGKLIDVTAGLQVVLFPALKTGKYGFYTIENKTVIVLWERRHSKWNCFGVLCLQKGGRSQKAKAMEHLRDFYDLEGYHCLNTAPNGVTQGRPGFQRTWPE